jgi:uroporphyrinogen decarboxylase
MISDKERFHALMNFEPCDRPLFWEQGFWGGTVERWYKEGMPEKHGVIGAPAYGDTVRGPATPVNEGDRLCFDIAENTGLDKPSMRVPVNLYLCPQFEEAVLAEHGDKVTIRDNMGIVKQTPKSKNSIPSFLSWPVVDFSDFERIAAERLNPATPERFPDNWTSHVQQLNDYDGVVAIGGHPCGFFGSPRYLLGEIALMTGFLEKPALVQKILDHLVELWSQLYDRILTEVKVDCIHIWEDMSFKNGPLISPALFDDFLVPAYRKVTDVARSHGVNIVLVDTDGDCSTLIPSFLDGGVTGLYPFEVQAGMDVKKIRAAFPRLQLLGGIDKMAIAAGPESIDAELERRIPGMVEQGGYIPMGDHQIPPEVSWQNYLYYRKKMSEICGNMG